MSVPELTKRQAKVLMLRFGLNGAGVHTQKEVAALFEVSKARVALIERNAMWRLLFSSTGDAIRERIIAIGSQPDE